MYSEAVFPLALAVLASITDGLLDKRVGKEHGIDEDETQASEGVESESEGSEGRDCGQEDKEQQKPKLCMRDYCQVSIVVFCLHTKRE